MEDKEIVCKDCGKTFVWTVGEQEFYASKGLTHAPVRCPECRRANKLKRQQQEQAQAAAVQNETAQAAETTETAAPAEQQAE